MHVLFLYYARIYYYINFMHVLIQIYNNLKIVRLYTLDRYVLVHETGINI
jgi:hypothetical protein